MNDIENDKNNTIFIEYSNDFNIKKALFNNNGEDKSKNMLLMKIKRKIITMNENKSIMSFVKLIALFSYISNSILQRV